MQYFTIMLKCKYKCFFLTYDLSFSIAFSMYFLDPDYVVQVIIHKM